MMIQVANHFYKDVKAPFLCLVCSEDKLTAEVKYEAPAPVGDKKALDESVDKDADVTVFPHLVSVEWSRHLFDESYVNFISIRFPLLFLGFS